MPTTNRDIVSRIKSLLRFTSSDIMITDRLILNVAQTTNVKLTSQQLQKRSASNSPNIFTEIPCLEMEPVPLYSCCSTESNCMVAISKIELPTIVDLYQQVVVRGVFSIDGKVSFKEIQSPTRYDNILNIYPNKKDNYYWIQNKRLYITDPNIEIVRLSAFFRDIVDISKYSSCKEDSEDCPINPLDMEWKGLPKLEDDIVRLAAELIMSSFKQIPPENTSDGREGN